MCHRQWKYWCALAAQSSVLLMLTACGGSEDNSPNPPIGPTGGSLPPQVITTTPGSHAKGVPANTPVSATFNAAIDPTTLSGSTFVLMDPNNQAVMGTVSYDDTTKQALYTPATPLQFDTPYSAHVTSDVKSTSGNPIIDREWTFTVEGPPLETMMSVGPVNNATDISVKGYAYAVFPGAVDPTSVDVNSFTLTDPAGTSVAGTAKLRGIHTVVFYPDAELELSTAYTAKLAPGIRTLNPVSTLTVDTSWTFTTAAARTATAQVGDGQFDTLSSIAIDADGNVLVTGSTDKVDPSTGEIASELLVSKLSPDGKLLWQSTFAAAPAQPFGVAIAVDNNKDTIVLAQLGHAATPAEDGVLVLKIGGAIGNEIWRKPYSSPGDDMAMGITVNSTGDIFVAAVANASMQGKPALGGNDAVVLRLLAKDGSLTWATQLGTPEDDEIHGIALDATGAVFVAGKTLGSPPGLTNLGQADILLAKLTADGVVSTMLLAGTPEEDIAFDVAVSGNSVIAGGYTTGSIKTGVAPAGGADAVTLAFDTNLKLQQWVEQKGTPDYDAVTAVTAGEAGAVYLTSVTETGFDPNQPPPAPDMPADMMAAFVRKLSLSNGGEQWSKSLVPKQTSTLVDPSMPFVTTHLQTSDLAVGASGNVFVTGTLHGGAELDGNVTLPFDSDGFVASFTSAGVKR